ncbi:hypothetical protein BKA70DRAFT_1569282 [Coprinopsis sp. MPI-PUGE-AT-0042]|nr:hypothetical protein BKA70DRAFT_1569282 [Coprinopsis sp. MPI-PUGE-AT-0042]
MSNNWSWKIRRSISVSMRDPSSFLRVCNLARRAYALHAPSSSSTFFVSRKDIVDHLQSPENKLTTTGDAANAPTKEKEDAKIEGAVQNVIVLRNSWISLGTIPTVSGCFILEPWMYSTYRDTQKFGVQNSYYPTLIYDLFWSCDKDRIEGVSPEVAMVTGVSQSDLEEPIAIRPTSETTTYPNTLNGFAPIPTLLGPQPVEQRLPLWNQETPVYSSGKKVTLRPTAKKEPTPKSWTSTYRQAYKDLLAVPLIPGVKSEKEKFDGGLYMTTLEGFIQAATFR